MANLLVQGLMQGNLFGGRGEALSGLAEQADGQVEVVEEGLVAGMDVLDETAQDEVIGVRFGPKADEEALTPITTRH